MSVSASRCRAERRAVGPRKREEGHTTQEKLRLTVAARRETATKLVEGGMSQRQVAKALGVDESTVRADLRENPAEDAGKSRTTKAERRAQREIEQQALRKSATSSSKSMRRSGFGGGSGEPVKPRSTRLRPPGGQRCEFDQTDGDASRAKGVTSNARTLTECDVSHRGVDPWRVNGWPQTTHRGSGGTAALACP
jgi:predicted transcriptional regulator